MAPATRALLLRVHLAGVVVWLGAVAYFQRGPRVRIRSVAALESLVRNG